MKFPTDVRKSFRIEERLKMHSGEELSSPDCVFKRSSIRKDFPDISSGSRGQQGHYEWPILHGHYVPLLDANGL